MAEPLQYTPEPPKIGPDAHEELQRLIESAHQHGVMRFANDLIVSNNQWLQVIVAGLNKESSRNAVQNLAMLLMVLGRIDPDRLCTLLFAAMDGIERAGQPAPRPNGKRAAPGLTGAWRMLHDDALWEAIWPVVEAVKTFNKGLERDIHKPISAFSGKQTKRP